MSVEPGGPTYVPWPAPPTVDYPERAEPRRGPHPFAIALAVFAAVLFLVSVVFLIFGATRRYPAPTVTMPAPVTTTVMTQATPAPVGSDGWLSGLHLMGYPVPDEAGAIKIGHDICANLRAGNGVVPKALEYLSELGNAPEGFNQGDAVALVWLAEDAYCPEQPRQ